MKGGTPIVPRATLRQLGLDRPRTRPKHCVLHACPFCGYRPHILRVAPTSGSGFRVRCSGRWTGILGKGCGAEGPIRKRAGDAVRLWNRRAGGGG
jgi:hypothetical protein